VQTAQLSTTRSNAPSHKLNPLTNVARRTLTPWRALLSVLVRDDYIRLSGVCVVHYRQGVKGSTETLGTQSEALVGCSVYTAQSKQRKDCKALDNSNLPERTAIAHTQSKVILVCVHAGASIPVGRQPSCRLLLSVYVASHNQPTIQLTHATRIVVLQTWRRQMLGGFEIIALGFIIA
jgi:hypothetical protein